MKKVILGEMTGYDKGTINTYQIEADSRLRNRSNEKFKEPITLGLI